MAKKNDNDATRKPVQRRSREAVSAIKTAAAQVLVERGYPQATTNHIAKRAGVSIGTLYQYFPNKDAIFEVCAEDFLRALRDASTAAVRSPDAASLEQRLLLLARSSAEVLAQHPGLLRALDATPMSGFRERVRHARDEVRAELEVMLAQLRPHASADDNAYAARFFAAAGEGLALDVRPGDDLDRLAQEVIKLAVGYLTAA